MHWLIRERLEDYLRGDSTKGLPSELEAHLAMCDTCREELNTFQEQSLLLRSLRPPGEFGPAPGFYARVMERVEAQQKGSFWGVFLEPAFARRMVFGSAAALLVLGSFLFLAERVDSVPYAAAPETLMAVEDHPPGLGQDPQRDRETILVTLATYQE